MQLSRVRSDEHRNIFECVYFICCRCRTISVHLPVCRVSKENLCLLHSLLSWTFLKWLLLDNLHSHNERLSEYIRAAGIFRMEYRVYLSDSADLYASVERREQIYHAIYVHPHSNTCCAVYSLPAVRRNIQQHLAAACHYTDLGSLHKKPFLLA